MNKENTQTYTPIHTHILKCAHAHTDTYPHAYTYTYIKIHMLVQDYVSRFN